MVRRYALIKDTTGIQLVEGQLKDNTLVNAIILHDSNMFSVSQKRTPDIDLDTVEHFLLGKDKKQTLESTRGTISKDIIGQQEFSGKKLLMNTQHFTGYPITIPGDQRLGIVYLIDNPVLERYIIEAEKVFYDIAKYIQDAEEEPEEIGLVFSVIMAANTLIKPMRIVTNSQLIKVLQIWLDVVYGKRKYSKLTIEKPTILSFLLVYLGYETVVYPNGTSVKLV